MNQIGFLDSGTIRGLLVAAFGVIGAIAGLFGINEAVFASKAAHVIDAVSAFLAVAGIAYAAWQRSMRPNPPITQVAAEKTAVRSEGEKGAQVLSHWLVMVLIGLMVLGLAGCSGTRAFYKQAASTGSASAYPKAVLEHHNAIGTQLATLVNSQSVSLQSKAKLMEGYRLTVCSSGEQTNGVTTPDCREGPSYKLDDSIRAFEAVRDAKTEAEMSSAVILLTPLITDLVNVIAGVK